MRGTQRAEARSDLEDFVWVAIACIRWVRDNAFAAVDAGELGADEALDLSDHADEADEGMLAPLAILYPVRDDKSWTDALAQAEQRMPDLGQPPKRGVREALGRKLQEAHRILTEEAMMHAYATAEAGTLSADALGPLEAGLLAVADDVEAAMVVVDPGWSSRALAEKKDPNERITLASHFENLEVLRETMRRTNEFERLLTEASRKLATLEHSRPAEAARINEQLAKVDRESASGVVMAFIGIAGLTEAEARALIGQRLM